MESRKAWLSEDQKRMSSQSDDRNECALFVNSGMLRVQPTYEMEALEKETLENMERDGLRDTQFLKSDPEDQRRADSLGWKAKLLNFEIPQTSPAESYEAVLDSLAGFVRCSDACAHYQGLAVAKGVEFHFGQQGAVESLVKVQSAIETGKEKITGLKTQDGVIHDANIVVVAGKVSMSTGFVHLPTDDSWVFFDAGSSRLEQPS
jgi:sarcosine oxidase/L-pipecolate oxidase